MWEAQLAAILKDLGITTRKFGLLGHIYAEPGISFSELARRSHITVQSAHTAVRTLVDDGLVGCHVARRRGQRPSRHEGRRRAQAARDRLFELDDGARPAPAVAASLDGIRPSSEGSPDASPRRLVVVAGSYVVGPALLVDRTERGGVAPARVVSAASTPSR
jgi:hypothetical protein